MKIKNNELYWAKVRPNAIIPTKDDENAGYDIYACFEDDYVRIPPNSTREITTGIAVAVTDNYYLQVEERGSTGSKGMKKSAGVVDSGFRGEIKIYIANCNDREIVISKIDTNELVKTEQFSDINKIIVYPYDKAIAQLVVHEVPKMDVKEVTYEELLTITSARGTGMLGSTDK